MNITRSFFQPLRAAASLLALGACAASLTLPRSLRSATSDQTDPQHPAPVKD